MLDESSKLHSNNMPQAARNSKRKSPLQHLIAGGCAGLVESSICHPLDTVKTVMQLQNNNLKEDLNGSTKNQPLSSSSASSSTRRKSKSMRESYSASSSSHRIKKRGLSTAITRRMASVGGGIGYGYGPLATAHSIVQKDGFLALYRGLTAVYTGIVPKMAIRFLTFEQYKDWLSSYTPLGRSTSATFTAGLFAGLTEAILVVTPAEVCKIRMQSETRQFNSVFHAAYSIVREEGIGALYKGVIPTMFRQGCNQAVNFTAYNAIKTRVLQEEGKSELASWQSMIIGGFSGGMGPLVNNPVSLLQLQLTVCCCCFVQSNGKFAWVRELTHYFRILLYCTVLYLTVLYCIDVGGCCQDSTSKASYIRKQSPEIYWIDAGVLFDCQRRGCGVTLEGHYTETSSHHAGTGNYVYHL